MREAPDNTSHRKLPSAPPTVYLPLTILALAGLGVLGFYTWQQHNIIKATEKNSQLALEQFMNASTQTRNNQNGVDIFLQGVQFHWSDKVYIDAGHLNARAIPGKSNVVNFDNPGSFVVNLGKSDIYILPSVLEGMFNESIFNYPGSKMRDLTVKIVDYDGQRKVKLAGSIHYILWIPFEMIVNFDIDKQTNTLVMTVDDLDLFGVIPATPVIKIKPFQLEKILTLPQNKHLTISKNKIFIKPFGLFPPPRVNGRFEAITVNNNHVVISFSSPTGVNESMGNGAKGNLILLKNGRTAFGNMSMTNTNLKITDSDQTDPFVFRMPTYHQQLPKSTIKMNADDSISVTMPDAP